MNIHDRLQQLWTYLSRDVWLLNLSEEELGPWQRRFAWLARMLYLGVMRFRYARCGIRASSLTTVTIISVVPVLAFAFAIAKGLGAYQKLQTEVIAPGLDRWLVEEQAPELRSAVDQIFRFVEETDLSSLGIIGLLTVAYAVIRLLGSVEDAFNDLWGIKSARSIARKIADYLSVTVIVPIVLFVAATASAFIESGAISALGAESAYLSIFLTLFIFPLVWVGFSVAYKFIPNTKVPFRAAWWGGVVGGSLWFIFHTLHMELQIGVANYNAIYAGFSAFPIFMLWVFFSWVAVLVGGSFAAAVSMSNQFRAKIIRENMNYRDRERLAVRIGVLLTQRFEQSQGAVPLLTVCSELHENEATISAVVSDLKNARLVEMTADNGVILSQSPARLTLIDFVDAQKGNALDLVGEDEIETRSILSQLKEKGRLQIDMSETIVYEAVTNLSRLGLVEEGQAGMLYPTDALHVRWAINALLDELRSSTPNRRMDEFSESIRQKRAMMQIREA